MPPPRLCGAVPRRGDRGAPDPVAATPRRSARRLGWGDEVWIDDLRVAAEIHDVGKLAIPDRVLLKPGTLTGEEAGLMQPHPEIGAFIIGDSDLPVLPAGASDRPDHHCRWDGEATRGVQPGKPIPRAARIVAVADVYDLWCTTASTGRPWTRRTPWRSWPAGWFALRPLDLRRLR